MGNLVCACLFADINNIFNNHAASRPSSVRDKLNLHHAEAIGGGCPPIRQTLLLSATRRLYLLRTFVSLLNLTLSICRLPSRPIPFRTSHQLPRLALLAHSRDQDALQRCSHHYYPRHVPIVIVLAVETYGVLVPEAS